MNLEILLKTNNNFLKQLLKTNKLWVKHSGEGKNSLMRALSNAVYFTEVYHSVIQKIIQSFVWQNFGVVSETLNLPNSYLQAYLDDPSLPEYESLNLEIAACIFDSRIKLYYTSEMSLCSDLFYRKTKNTIKILRVYDNHYAAVFPSKIRDVLPEAQNIVLSIILSALNASPIEMIDFNEGKFINFEFQDWLSNSSRPAHKSVSKDPFPPESRSISYYKQSFHSFESFNPNSSEESYLGEDIISIFQNRKCSSKNASIKFLEAKYDDLINGITKYKKEDRNDSENNEIPVGNWERKEACMVNEFTKVSETELRPDEMFEFEIDLKEMKMPNLQQSKMISVFDECFNDQINLPKAKTETFFESSPNNYEPLTSYQEAFFYSFRADARALDSKERSIQNTSNHHSEQLKVGQQPQSESKSIYAVHYGSPNKKSSLRDRMQKKMKQSSPNSIAYESFDFDKSDQRSNLFLQQMMFNWPSMPQDIDPAFFMEQFNMDHDKAKNKPRKCNSPSVDNQNKGIISKEVYEGKLKFFDEKNNFGFITANIKGATEDIFIYGGEFEAANINLDLIRSAKYGHIIMFKFNVASYFGKYKRSKKAVNLHLSL